MNRKRLSALFLGMVALLLIVTCAYGKADEKKEASAEYGFLSNLKSLKEISEIMDIINTKFVSEKEISKEQLLQGAIKGMIEALDDPHTSYFTKKEYNSFSEDIKGEYAGVGMVVSQADKILTVVSPIEDTPAQKAGMKPNDKIIKIDDTSTIELPLEKCVELLKGKAGTKVKITVVRNGIEKPFEVILERATIKLKYVKYKMLDNQIGYLRITQFGDNITVDVRKAVDDLVKQGIKGMILDLRNNPGGALPEAIGVASVFDGKSPIVTVRDKEGKTEIYDSEGKSYIDFPLVVLINEGSASASEIVAGAIKDHKRGLLIGAKSYGKGSVQTLIPLPDGDAVKLTIAKYYTPSGVSIHKKGIEPDIAVEDKEPGANFEGFVTNIVDKNAVAETATKASIETKEGQSQKPHEDVQLIRAIKALKEGETLKQ